MNAGPRLHAGESICVARIRRTGSICNCAKGKIQKSNTFGTENEGINVQ